MTGLHFGFGLLGFTLFAWFVSYHSSSSSREKRDRHKLRKNASGIVANSLIQGPYLSHSDYYHHGGEEIGHEDGGTDDLCE
ncbi:hypothetical protein [Alicyclobacillus sp. SO9]|uniref:hypothetical protein n=1 Tax=Alicyclobacillus sp. SO9 TaxID=2665646 RepID=UPI0018E82C07|nr:hypothetical protein [Alicyclobacillus sp. SO9]QQE78577.1 hypothetical protein GI364_22395 [Alicyclobacillus sp. SO9]